ncbi:hypothetical protein PG989_011175 [Apiospora arundinis]|uniref:Rx N-terminal domain-containing protein n=1 Tax=Apiospora arundinis TaxID=335852 RepID=A0ABR2HRR9_9PEZI
MNGVTGEVGTVAKSVSSIRRLICSTLKATIVLRDHLKRIRYQPPAAPDVLKDLRSLEQILEDAVDLLNKHNDVSAEDPRLEMSLGRLETDLQDCLNQINDWVADDALQPSCGKQWSDLFKKIRYAGYREVYDELSTKLAAHRAVLWLHLTFLKRQVPGKKEYVRTWILT